MKLTDAQWRVLAPLIPEVGRPRGGRGRPRRDPRHILEAVFWYLTTPRAVWRRLPREFPTYQTCSRRFLEWKKKRKNGSSALGDVLRALLHHLHQQSGVDIVAVHDAAARGDRDGIAAADATMRTWAGRNDRPCDGWEVRTANAVLRAFVRLQESGGDARDVRSSLAAFSP